MKYYALSDKGLCRNENQDNYGYIGDGRVFFTVVCDGMGGAVGGKLAAELAVFAALDAVRAAIGADETGSHAEPRPLNDFEVRRILRCALDAANSAVFQRASEDADLRGMGTTIVALFVYYGKAYVMHVGDSRLYLFREGKLHRVTRDHSYVQSLVELGEITEEEARTHERRNVITRALGIGESVTGDYQCFDLHPLDLFLLCSDGLSGMVEEAQIENLLSVTEKSVQARCEALVSAALAAGGEDNVTALLAQTEDEDVASVWEALAEVCTEDITVTYDAHPLHLDAEEDDGT